MRVFQRAENIHTTAAGGHLCEHSRNRHKRAAEVEYSVYHQQCFEPLFVYGFTSEQLRNPVLPAYNRDHANRKEPDPEFYLPFLRKT